MPRFFVEPRDINNNRAVITGPEVKHINKVLRLKEGDAVTLLDGLGNSYKASIYRCSKDTVMCHVQEKQVAGGEPPVQITVVQGLPKGDKMELVIQKGTELGITRFIPLKSKRSIVRLDEKKAGERKTRWQRVALEAAKQCRRPLVPVVDEPMEWHQVLSAVPQDALLLMPYEDEQTMTLKDIIHSEQHKQNFYIIIGPEGGFEPEEVALAKDYGVKTVSLGPRIMRTETAGLAMASIIMYQYGDLGGI